MIERELFEMYEHLEKIANNCNDYVSRAAYQKEYDRIANEATIMINSEPCDIIKEQLFFIARLMMDQCNAIIETKQLMCLN